jgi:hypothetical protein
MDERMTRGHTPGLPEMDQGPRQWYDQDPMQFARAGAPMPSMPDVGDPPAQDRNVPGDSSNLVGMASRLLDMFRISEEARQGKTIPPGSVRPGRMHDAGSAPGTMPSDVQAGLMPLPEMPAPSYLARGRQQRDEAMGAEPKGNAKLARGKAAQKQARGKAAQKQAGAKPKSRTKQARGKAGPKQGTAFRPRTAGASPPASLPSAPGPLGADPRSAALAGLYADMGGGYPEPSVVVSDARAGAYPWQPDLDYQPLPPQPLPPDPGAVMRANARADRNATPEGLGRGQGMSFEEYTKAVRGELDRAAQGIPTPPEERVGAWAGPARSPGDARPPQTTWGALEAAAEGRSPTGMDPARAQEMLAQLQANRQAERQQQRAGLLPMEERRQLMTARARGQQVSPQQLRAANQVNTGEPMSQAQWAMLFGPEALAYSPEAMAMQEGIGRMQAAAGAENPEVAAAIMSGNPYPEMPEPVTMVLDTPGLAPDRKAILADAYQRGDTAAAATVLKEMVAQGLIQPGHADYILNTMEEGATLDNPSATSWFFGGLGGESPTPAVDYGGYTAFR